MQEFHCICRIQSFGKLKLPNPKLRLVPKLRYYAETSVFLRKFYPKKLLNCTKNTANVSKTYNFEVLWKGFCFSDISTEAPAESELGGSPGEEHDHCKDWTWKYSMWCLRDVIMSLWICLQAAYRIIQFPALNQMDWPINIQQYRPYRLQW